MRAIEYKKNSSQKRIQITPSEMNLAIQNVYSKTGISAVNSYSKLTKQLISRSRVQRRQSIRKRDNSIIQSLFGLDYQSVVSGVINPGPVDSEQSTSAIQAVIGALGVSFVLTFFVAPKYKDQFKEEEQWKDIYIQLKQQGVKSITPQEAKNRRNNGAAIVDVRLSRKFENGGIDGSVNIPLYQPISGMGIAPNVRRVGFAFFGIFGTERNLQFIEDMMQKFGQNEEIIIVCESGGSLQTKPGVDTGFQSQSLKAVYELQKSGFSKIIHMKGGLGEWNREVEPLVFPEDMTFEKPKQPLLLSIGSFFNR
eukprot:TRINITY_DN1132_c0_g1_i3.p1 TRINITY_DN1132_c0_g1~~TRINITY_DN1132_c0_g1_i3.p1  ORF type:complete len:309 (+),score=32.68 TRINITY_DN1132_c0_g1_i3:2-928(+)